jgi:hypothetical protein
MHGSRTAAGAHGHAGPYTRTCGTLTRDGWLTGTERSAIDGLSRSRSAWRPRRTRTKRTPRCGRGGHAGCRGAGLAQLGCQVRARWHYRTSSRLSGQRARRRSGCGGHGSAGRRGVNGASSRGRRHRSPSGHAGPAEDGSRRRSGFVDAGRHRLAGSGEHLAGASRGNGSGRGRCRTAR